MTWWDHQTDSIWVQLTGEAIWGPMEGTRLTLLPMSIEPWNTWLTNHPDTVLLERPDSFSYNIRGEIPLDRFVIGIELAGGSKGYPYKIASEERVINDEVAGHPIVIYVDPDTRSISSYLRRVGDLVLTMELVEGALTDIETGSKWDPVRGLSIEGELQGEIMLEVPWVTSFDWAWQNFHPDTELYSGR